jgi:hypothetical protein
MAPGDGLTPEVIRDLVERFDSLNAAALAAMERPKFAREFELVGARTVIGRDGQPYFYLTWPEAEAHFWNLVVAALSEEPPSERDDLIGGTPYLRADYEAAGKLHAKGKMTVDGIEKRRQLSTRRAYRIYRQFVVGAVLYDDQVGLRPGPGYRWDPAGRENDPPTYKLIRR